MNDSVVFVSDGKIFEKLISSNHQDVQNAQMVFVYQSWRTTCNRIITIPKIYEKIKSKIQHDQECLEYFKGYFEQADFIGNDSTLSEKEELIALAKALYAIHGRVIVITDKYHNDDEFKQKVGKDISVSSIDKVNGYLMAKTEFYDKIFQTYFDTSSV